MIKIFSVIVLLCSFSNNSFSQDMKDYLEHKAEKHIERIVAENDGPDDPWDCRDPTLKPFIWTWKGYEKPLYIDSLLCKDPILLNWAVEELRLPYDTLTLIQKERMFQIIRIDTLEGKIVLCSINKRFLLGCNSIYEYLYENNEFNKEYAEKSDDMYLNGYWWVQDKWVLVGGNAVDLFFKRYEKQRMGSPLPPHRTINDIYEPMPLDLTDGTYWIYKDGLLSQHCLYNKEDQESWTVNKLRYQASYMIHIKYNVLHPILNHEYYDLLRQSFKDNKL